MRLPVRVRRMLACPIRRIPVRIRAGPNRGRRWSLAVSGRGILAGRFEPEKFDVLDRLVRPGDVVWDVGAHYGFATLIAARRAGPGARVVAFEPSVANRWYLERHLEWNGENGVEVVPCALAETDRSDVFGGTGGSIAFRLGQPGETVEVRSVTSLLDGGLPLPALMKIDVEGAERLLLEGARAAFEQASARRSLPMLLLAVHDAGLFRECEEILEALGYLVVPSRGIAAYLDGAAWRGDPDLLAVPPRRRVDLPSFREIPLFAEGRGA